jgi:uncharacterized protein involved in response to NO
MVLLVGFPSAIAHYDLSERKAGKSKYSPGKMPTLSISAITSLTNAPLRLITLWAMAGTGVLMVESVYIVWIRLFTDRGVPGWASSALPTLFIDSLNLLAIGALGEYTARVLTRSSRVRDTSSRTS